MQGAYLPSFWAFIVPALGTMVAVPLWHGGLVNNMVAFVAAIAAGVYFSAPEM